MWLPHDEQDLIRKFLFLLKYRDLGFHKRFYHDDAEDYSANAPLLYYKYYLRCNLSLYLSYTQNQVYNQKQNPNYTLNVRCASWLGFPVLRNRYS